MGWQGSPFAFVVSVLNLTLALQLGLAGALFYGTELGEHRRCSGTWPLRCGAPPSWRCSAACTWQALADRVYGSGGWRRPCNFGACRRAPLAAAGPAGLQVGPCARRRPARVPLPCFLPPRRGGGRPEQALPLPQGCTTTAGRRSGWRAACCWAASRGRW
jgi:hypothetical protein